MQASTARGHAILHRQPAQQTATIAVLVGMAAVLATLPQRARGRALWVTGALLALPAPRRMLALQAATASPRA